MPGSDYKDVSRRSFLKGARGTYFLCQSGSLTSITRRSSPLRSSQE
jgi:hypothetical protein